MTKGKIFGLVLGLFFLIGSGVVVGLTVVRLQNQKATVTQPKAAGNTPWPQCVKEGPYACRDEDCFSTTNKNRNVVDCCPRIATEGYDACEWPARGWCTAAQCDAGNWNMGQARCSGGPGTLRCRCDLYWQDASSTCGSGSGGGGASFTATYPTGGTTVSSLTPTFTWTANTTGLTYNCLNVHTDQCQTPIPSLSRCPSLSDRSWTETTPLQPNTTYYWVIYGQPGNPAPGSGCQSFRTQAAAPTTHLACVDKACTVVSGGGSNTEGCQTAGAACSGGTCTTDAGCPTGQKCVSGTCTTPTTYYGCVNKTCAVVSGASANANGCTAAGGTCCSSNSDCPSDQTCDTTKTPNSCSISGQVSACWGNEGADGKCYDCNGDGAINILDFSCFAKKWLENI